MKITTAQCSSPLNERVKLPSNPSSSSSIVLQLNALSCLDFDVLYFIRDLLAVDTEQIPLPDAANKHNAFLQTRHAGSNCHSTLVALNSCSLRTILSLKRSTWAW